LEKTFQDSNTQKQAKPSIDRSLIFKKIVFGVAVILCLSSLISPPVALLLGLIVAWFVGHPYLHLNNKVTQRLLQLSVVGLGFGMNVNSAMKAGKAGILFTIASIVSTFVIGYAMGKFLKIEKKS